MHKLFCLVTCLFVNSLCAAPLSETQNSCYAPIDAGVLEFDSTLTATKEAQVVFQFFLDEVELDDSLTLEEQLAKVQDFKTFAANLSPDVAIILTQLLVGETHVRVVEMLQNAAIDESEFNAYLADYQQVISRPQNRNVEFAREMLFFVAELKIHRQYIYEFGVALGCPEEQLLRHDLCKLSAEQLEGYARFFRGGRLDEDKDAYLAAWGEHQHEEHHLESYSKEGFSFDSMTDEHLQNNMLEVVADNLAASKQRGGGSLIERLVHTFPKSNPHPRLIPFLELAYIKAHSFYLESEAGPESDNIFKGLPCWNNEVAEVFGKLKAGS